MKTINITPTMLRLLLSLLVLSTLAACGDAEEEDPQTSEEIQQVLQTRRAELRELTKEVEDLEARLVEIDPDFAPNYTLVSYQTIGTGDFSNYSRVQATVLPEESATATPEIPGRILRMNFEEGDPIRRGQLVAVLDVEGTETQRAELETAAELAKTVYERQEKLWEQNIGSELQYLEAKNNYERIQQQLKAIGIQEDKRNVYAPLSGTVERVALRTGESAMPGAPILTISSTNDLNVVADAPESLLTKVKLRDRVKVRVPALGLEFDAPVTRIGRTVDPANRTFEVEIAVPREHVGELKANLLAEVEILDYAAEDQIVVSQDFIQQDVEGRRFVFVAEDGEEGQVIARKTFIETGASFNNRAVVEDGLATGDRIITSGSRGLTDGQNIELSEATSPGLETPQMTTNNG